MLVSNRSLWPGHGKFNTYKKTCKHSFMTLTCQAEEDFFSFWGDSMAHIIEFNCVKLLNHMYTTAFSNVSMLSA